MKIKAFLQHYGIVIYFSLALFIAYGGFFLVIGLKLLRGGTEQPSDVEFILFPMMVFGVCLVSLLLTGLQEGRQGLRALFFRLAHLHVGTRWYAVACLIPPFLILAILLILRTLVSPDFTPDVFLPGLLFGLPTLLEEIGWIGYAFPRMRIKQSPLAAAILLGILWGLWHAPVVDYLGTATPHGSYWVLFFLSFIAIVTAMRVLIVWVYSNTSSLLLAWLMHASMTTSLVVFDPLNVSPAQETLWYWIYAVTLWIVATVVILRYGSRLAR